MLVSIVIPMYNVKNYISKTIFSIIEQSNNDFEVLIIDDGSTDDSYQIVKNIIDENSLNNFKIIRKKNGGVSSARNTGLIESTGDYVLFLDGDDYISNDFVHNISKVLNNNTPDIICWKFDQVRESGTTLRQFSDMYKYDAYLSTGFEILSNIIVDKNMWIWTGSAVYNRKFIIENDLHYTEGCSNGEDQEFTLKALSKSNEVIFINKTLSYYVDRSGSITNSYNVKKFQAVEAMYRVNNFLSYNYNFNKIAEKIINDNLILNYFSNFDISVRILRSKGYKTQKAIKKIYNDINNDNSNLIPFVINCMNNYNGKNKRLKFKIRLYLLSPYIYTLYLNIRRLLKQRKEK